MNDYESLSEIGLGHADIERSGSLCAFADSALIAMAESMNIPQDKMETVQDDLDRVMQAGPAVEEDDDDFSRWRLVESLAESMPYVQ